MSQLRISVPEGTGSIPGCYAEAKSPKRYLRYAHSEVTHSERGFTGNKVFLKMYPDNTKIKCIIHGIEPFVNIVSTLIYL